jgi:hypothetical protein
MISVSFSVASLLSYMFLLLRLECPTLAVLAGCGTNMKKE